MSITQRHIEQEKLRAREVAVYLGIGLSTVWLFAKQGKLRPIKLGARTTVFLKSEIDEWVESCRNDEVAS
ncbi:MAG: helix-turn-helix transcriptional regulator [bacterium]